MEIDMNIYATKDYRKIIVTLIDEKKFLDKKYTFQNMAKFIRIQKPYLSKVINKKADFNTDQIYMACQFLSLSQEETDYMMLLLEYDRTSYDERRKKILSEIIKIQDQNRDSKTVLNNKIHNIDGVDFDKSNMSEYYLDPLIQIVHIFLMIPRFNKNPNLIAEQLSITEKNLHDVFKKLVELNILAVKNNKLEILVKSMHLPRESKLVPVNHQLMKQYSMYRISRLPWSLKKSWMVTFNSNEESRKKIEIEFNVFLEKIRNISMEGSVTDCYQLSFDLFPWSQPE